MNPRVNFVQSANKSLILKCFIIKRYTISHYQRHAVFQRCLLPSDPPELSWVQYSVLPVPMTMSPDNILHVNLLEGAQLGSVLRILGQNITV